MELIQRSLSSRVFLLQFLQIMSEFGNEIPWLSALQNLEWASNPRYFEEFLLTHFNCDNSSAIIPYQFISSDRSKEYYGGIIYFEKTPETFIDPMNIRILEQLENQHYWFGSCLQVRALHRSQKHGPNIMKRTTALMRDRLNPFWGVLSNPRTLTWHLKSGARLLNSMPNKDNLYLITYE